MIEPCASTAKYVTDVIGLAIIIAGLVIIVWAFNRRKDDD